MGTQGEKGRLSVIRPRQNLLPKRAHTTKQIKSKHLKHYPGLFDNQIGDAGARAAARLVGPRLLELHLSHNRVGTAGAKALLAAAPAAGVRPRGLRPLWLRLEWNEVDAAELTRFIDEVRSLSVSSSLVCCGWCM